MAASKKKRILTELPPPPPPPPAPVITIIAPPDSTLLQLAAAFAAIRDGQVLYGREGLGWFASDPPTADGQKLAWDAVAKKVVWVNV